MSDSEKKLAETLARQGPKLENLLKRRFFVAPSFEIYGSASGLYDFGPSGCAVKNELEALWRRHFIMEDDLMEICGPNLTPHCVLKASGHVDRFQDFMCEDVITRDCFRADKYLTEFLQNVIDIIDQVLESKEQKAKAWTPTKATPAYCRGFGELGANELRKRRGEVDLEIAKLEGMTADQLYTVITKYQITSPVGNCLGEPFPFNLMFATKIGPKQNGPMETGIAYLRPETAQGIFVNFRRLSEQNGWKMPFGAACIGTSFRNEIAPRNGLLRVREFPMAEIEYFCDPISKSPFPKFRTVADLEISLYDRDSQLDLTCVTAPKLTLKQAISKGIIDNETLAYFIGRAYLFLKKVGINTEALRFRQHLKTEMAHYASDCWDAEILTSYKWVECVGIADRSAFDLTQHSRAAKVDLSATRQLSEKKTIRKLSVKLEKKMMGPLLKKDLQTVCEVFDSMDQESLRKVQEELQSSAQCTISIEGNKTHTLSEKYIKIEDEMITLTEESYTPNVIEPSFGIGRILQAIFEHSYRERDEERTYLALPPVIAPIKCSILPLSNQPEFGEYISRIRSSCLARGITVKVDASTASIGKRYARTDEIGIPFGVTVDFQTLKDHTVTMREAVSMTQIRLAGDQVAPLLSELISNIITWDDALASYPNFVQQE